jgi:polysaccharide export outer membrane protein
MFRNFVAPMLLVTTIALSAPAQTLPPATPGQAGTGVSTPPDYVIGPDDVLTITFWREKDLSTEVVVRPDGKISLPLLNEIAAAGLTPDQLRKQITEAANEFVEDPTPSVVVKAINSRKVFITGQVLKPGMYALPAQMTVLQLISIAGGLQEYADHVNISIVRTENGRQMAYRFNYQDVLKRRNFKQNIELKPGDTVVVP